MRFDPSPRSANISLSIAALFLLSACSLTTEGELYTGASGASASSGQGPGSGSSSSQGAGGGGAGGGGTGGGGVGGGSVGSGGMGGGGVEDCFDGADNDNDEKIDCADLADCAASVECVSGIPAGFTKYVRYEAEFYTGAPSAPPLCPDGSPSSAFFAGPGDPATCEACSCAWPGAACSAPGIDCFLSTTSCANGADNSQMATTTACIALPNFTGGAAGESCKLTTPAMVTSPGVCSIMGGAATKGPMWKEQIFVCDVTSTMGGCLNGEMCAPKPPETFEGSICVAVDGEVACPNGWMTQQITAYKDGSDIRGCSGCACTSGVSCANDGGYTAFDENDCTGTSTVVGASCTDVSIDLGVTGSLKPKLATVMNGQCGGGDPIGVVQGTDPITICCQ